MLFVARPIVGYNIYSSEVNVGDVGITIELKPEEFRAYGVFESAKQSSFGPDGKMAIYFGPSEDVGVGRFELRGIKFAGERGIGAPWESDLEIILKDARPEICRLRADRIVITYDDRNLGERREVEAKFQFEKIWAISFWIERILELPPLLSIRTRARWSEICES